MVGISAHREGRCWWARDQFKCLKIKDERNVMVTLILHELEGY